MVGPRVLREFAAAYPDAFFIEIGSNDGEQHDHLRPLILEGRWRGLMVEPVPYIFERLRRNYEGIERVTAVNAAVAPRAGELPFFHLVPREQMPRDDLPTWYDGIGSFSREAVLSHRDRIPDIEERLVERRVRAVTFAMLCEQHGVDKVDLLLLDTEGYDCQILKSIDFRAHTPRLVIYEHYHLEPHEQHDCVAHLESFGFETLAEGFDTFCLQPADDRLTASWRRFKPAVGAVFAHEERR
jgi:FkbM family methyltransferase